MRKYLVTGILGAALLMTASNGHATTWEKQGFDFPNKNVDANYRDTDSVKTHARTLSWTEKFILSPFGITQYNKHLMQFPACKSAIARKGEVTQHQLDFQISAGKYRMVAKRNYNKNNELICTDSDMGKDLDQTWHVIEQKSPMEERYYDFVTKHNIGNI